MTEEEWLACAGPLPMLQATWCDPLTDRKLRLFGCACCRRAWMSLGDLRSQRAIDAAERLADGGMDEAERAAAVIAAGSEVRPTKVGEAIPSRAIEAVFQLLNKGHSDIYCGWYAAGRAVSESRQEYREQTHLLRDILGDPFRPVVCSPTWRTRDVMSLAQACYDERHLPSGELHLDRLAVLADALTDAGCDDAAILGHLRSPGPHVRGCWVVDLLIDRR